MIQDVRHPLRRLIEIDGYADATSARDGKIRGVPLGPVRRKNSYAVSHFHAKFHERAGKSCYTPKKFRRGDRFPAVPTAEHLGPQVRQLIDGVQKSGGKGAVIHRDFDCTPAIYVAQLPRPAVLR